MAAWEGHDRRGSPCCDGDMQSRVRALEIYRETHSEKLDRLTGALEKNNDHLSKMNTRLTELRTTQRNTHAFAGLVGSVMGFLGERLIGAILPKI